MERVLGGVVLVLLGLAPDAGRAAALAPHLAAYRLNLARDSIEGPLLGVDGGLVIEWRRACDGWLARQRLGFVATTEEGEGFTHDVRFSSWEAFDGRRLRYSVRSFDGDQIAEEFRGAAWHDGDGGRADFKTPDDRQVQLPPGTVFPTDHLERILAGAAGGERFLSHDVFDGWGYDALTRITTVIGQPRMVDPSAAEGTKENRAWPVSMAYYKIAAPSDLPEFEANFLLDEQGVLHDLTLDYGEFSLEAELVEFELLEPSDC